MGKVTRPSPARLAGKLRQIRETLGLSQNEMIRRLGLAEELHQASVSGYEIGTREPPLPVLLKYARAAGVCVDVLIDDQLDLPEGLPSLPDHHINARRRTPQMKGERRSAR
jgi:transcriptional regulator with XRE-family HTH domain